jgi:hypothetical protein
LAGRRHATLAGDLRQWEVAVPAVTAAARAAWPRRWSGVLAWTVWALAMLGLAAGTWLDHLLCEGGSPEAAWLLQASTLPLLVAAVSAATVGALLGLGLLVVVDAVVSEYVA